MTNINLLPWREELREERKKEFLTALGFVVVVAALILLLVDRVFNNEIDNQTSLNSYLRSQITSLDQRIVEIRELQAQKEELTERMTIIQDLQGTRPVIVRVFDDLVNTLPDGIYYNRVARTGDTIRLEGSAESNESISTLMRRLDNSTWFTDPNLQQITADPMAINARGNPRNLFILTVTVTTPDQDESEE